MTSPVNVVVDNWTLRELLEHVDGFRKACVALHVEARENGPSKLYFEGNVSHYAGFVRSFEIDVKADHDVSVPIDPRALSAEIRDLVLEELEIVIDVDEAELRLGTSEIAESIDFASHRVETAEFDPNGFLDRDDDVVAQVEPWEFIGAAKKVCGPADRFRISAVENDSAILFEGGYCDFDGDQDEIITSWRYFDSAPAAELERGPNTVDQTTTKFDSVLFEEIVSTIPFEAGLEVRWVVDEPIVFRSETGALALLAPRFVDDGGDSP